MRTWTGSTPLDVLIAILATFGIAKVAASQGQPGWGLVVAGAFLFFALRALFSSEKPD